MNQGPEGNLWSVQSLDAILLALWSLLIIGAAATLFLREFVTAYTTELIAQLSVVFFLLISAYRLGVAYDVNALLWYPACYGIILVHSFLFRKVALRMDTFIEHASYAMMAFIVLLSVVRVFRYYRRKWNKKKKSN